jgi:Fur family transcriptional regulator, ferric uptake regulator
MNGYIRKIVPTVSDSLARFFETNGVKHTAQREAIVREFLNLKEHVTIDDLLRRVRSSHPGVGYATVYRTLRLLKEVGLADERHFGDGKALYEPITEHHHDHLICTSCHKIVEFENEEIETMQQSVAKLHGFEISGHKMELYGLCPECQAKDANKKNR